MKSVHWCILSAVFIVSVVYFKEYHDFGEKKERQEAAQRDRHQYEMDKELFNTTFEPIVEMTHKKDVAIYSILIEKDQKILSRISEIVEDNSTTNAHIRLWTDLLISSYQREIRNCERLKAKIEDLESRPNAPRNKAWNLRYEGGDTLACGCDCCNND